MSSVKTPSLKSVPVDVVMPEVKLTLADLSYMTGLLKGGTRCAGQQKTIDKLIFLGLIEMADVPACPKAIAKFDADVKAFKEEIRRAVRAENWAIVDGLPYNLRPNNRPKSKSDYVLTASGRELMKKGRARSMTATKVGCIK